MSALLTIKNLTVSTDKKTILRKLSVVIKPGEMHVLMGPNGSGKSTLAYALLGHPHYTVTASELSFAGKNLKTLTTDERARLGLFLGFQYPLAISGLSLSHFLPAALQTRLRQKKSVSKQAYVMLADKMAAEQRVAAEKFRSAVGENLQKLGLKEEMLYRSLNEGFSGGEKKKAEILQMLALHPKLAILDEPDSGLDVDALKKIAAAINAAHKHGTAILLITHYQRILKYLKPDKVHVLANGKLVKSGGPELARVIERKGYEQLVSKKKIRKSSP